MLATTSNIVLALIKQAGFQHAAQACRWLGGHIDQSFALLISEHMRRCESHRWEDPLLLTGTFSRVIVPFWKSVVPCMASGRAFHGVTRDT